MKIDTNKYSILNKIPSFVWEKVSNMANNFTNLRTVVKGHFQAYSVKCTFWNLYNFGFQLSVTGQQLVSLENPENLNNI